MIKILSRFEIYGSIVFFIVFCVYFFPSFNNEIRVHDTFDGNFPIRHALIQSGHFFDLNPNTIVPGSMNGLPRGVFPRFTEITGILMFLFGSLNGYALTFLLVRFLAFLGIYLFGRDHLNIKDDKKGLLLMIAFAYACLPFFVMHGLTVAGIPLVLWAFFNITKNQRTGMSYLVFTLFVLWSNFVLVGVHSIFLLGTLFLYFSWHNKKIQWKLLLAIMFIGTLYILSDYMLIYLHYFNKDFHSSRGEFDKFLGLNFNGVIGNSAKLFFTGDYSTANYFGYLFIPFILFFAGAWFRNKKEENYRSGIAFLTITALFAVIISLLDWKSFSFFL